MYSPEDIDYIIRTVYGEAALEPAGGQQAVASVILNRARSSGKTPKDVVLAPNQFEPWGARRKQLESLNPDSPIYRRIADAIKPVIEGATPDPTGGADHFFAPKTQAALGRKAPSWAQGPSQDIGRHRFFKLGYGQPQQPQQVASAEPSRLAPAGAQQQPPADMTAGIDTSQPGSVTGGMNPIQDPSVKGMFLGGQGTGVQTPPEPPKDISPQASRLGEDLAEDPDQPPQQQPNLMDRLSQAGMGPALVRMGAGLASNATRGWGAGIGAGLSGAQDALDNQFDQRQKFLNTLAATAYRKEQLRLAQERNDIYKNAQGKRAVVEIFDENGRPQKVLVDPQNPGQYTKIGGAKSAAMNLTAPDKEAILGADEQRRAGKAALVSLEHALAINEEAKYGPLAETRGYITSLWGEKAGEHTTDLANTVTNNAVAQLKAAFGGNPTEGERKIWLDLQGSVNLPPKQRKKIFERAVAAIHARNEYNKQLSDSLRNSTYYREGGAPEMLDAPAALPPPPGVDPLDWEDMSDEEKAAFQ
jgi:hypothetical protein